MKRNDLKYMKLDTKKRFNLQVKEIRAKIEKEKAGKRFRTASAGPEEQTGRTRLGRWMKLVMEENRKEMIRLALP